MRTYTVPKGKHDFRPWQIPWPILWPWFKGLRWRVRFDESVRYSLPGGYRGWNKGGGVIFSLFNNKIENHLWGWRWDEGLQAISFTAYSNTKLNEKGRFVGWVGAGDKLVNAKIGQTVEIEIVKYRKLEVLYTFRNLQTGVEQQCIHPTRKWFLLAKHGTLWFGGQYEAPHDISCELEVERIK